MSVPDAFNGPFTSAIIGTYGIDLDFLENHLLHRMPSRLRSRIFLADATQIQTALSSGYKPRRTNRTYVLAPVYTPNAFHLKFILLTGPEHGRLLVGSGNTSVGGYIGAGEAFTTYDITPDDRSHATQIESIRRFLQQLNETYPIDHQAWNLIEDQFAQAPWIPEDTTPSTITHNLDTSHLAQLAQAVGSDNVTEVIAYAPFHDRKAEGIKAIIETFKPGNLTLLVQQKQTVLDINATLKAVRPLRNHFTAYAIEAPEPYNPTYLHAKFILVRTPSTDYLLQGSANLSGVALNRAGIDANVELCNLLTAAPGGFDPFITTLTSQAIENDLRDLTTADWSETLTTSHPVGLVRDATWLTPKLTGTISEPISQNDITVSLNQQTLTPTHTDITPDQAGTTFTLTFSPEDAHKIDTSNSIEIAINGHEALTLYPYRVHDLLRMSSTGNRIDVLRDAGTLDLTDKEVREMIEKLDQVLIVDLQSAWKLAHPNTGNDTEDPPQDGTIKYEDIDWEKIRQHAAYKAYTGHRLAATHSPTELGILLQSLTDRFNQEAAGYTTSDDRSEDLSTEQTPEDAEAIDEATADIDPDDETETLNNVTNRTKRLWGNFSRRFVRGLQDPEFVEAVGPSVIVLSYVAFNHLLRLLRNKELINEQVGHDSHTALWGFMWGTGDTPGYIQTLPTDERHIALKTLEDNKDVPLTLASIEDSYWYLWSTDQDTTELRSIIRTLLEHTDFKPTRQALDEAANATSNLTAADLVDDLEDLATGVYTSEIDAELAAALKLPPTSLRWETDTVNVHGQVTAKQTLHLPDDYELTPQAAAAALATWHRLEPSATYRRMSAGKLMALQDDETGTSLHYDRQTHIETPIDLNEAEPPAWASGLQEWHQIAA